MRNTQLTFESLLDHSFRERSAAIDRYIRANKERYQGFALLIRPHLDDSDQVWTRFAFAILSANAPFDASVKALAYARKNIGQARRREVITFGMVPAKADYLNALPFARNLLLGKLRQPGENWHEYRIRLRDTTAGLGLAKASFAAGLLYPLEAEVACVDTHIQKVYLGRSRWQRVSLRDYLTVERKIHTIAQAHGVNTFLAQWMIWDHTRGHVETHAIFPGAHKDGEVSRANKR